MFTFLPSGDVSSCFWITLLAIVNELVSKSKINDAWSLYRTLSHATRFSPKLGRWIRFYGVWKVGHLLSRTYIYTPSSLCLRWHVLNVLAAPLVHLIPLSSAVLKPCILHVLTVSDEIFQVQIRKPLTLKAWEAQMGGLKFDEYMFTIFVVGVHNTVWPT